MADERNKVGELHIDVVAVDKTPAGIDKARATVQRAGTEMSGSLREVGTEGEKAFGRVGQSAQRMALLNNGILRQFRDMRTVLSRIAIPVAIFAALNKLIQSLADAIRKAGELRAELGLLAEDFVRSGSAERLGSFLGDTEGAVRAATEAGRLQRQKIIDNISQQQEALRQRTFGGAGRNILRVLTGGPGIAELEQAKQRELKQIDEETQRRIANIRSLEAEKKQRDLAKQTAEAELQARRAWLQTISDPVERARRETALALEALDDKLATTVDTNLRDLLLSIKEATMQAGTIREQQLRDEQRERLQQIEDEERRRIEALQREEQRAKELAERSADIIADTIKDAMERVTNQMVQRLSAMTLTQESAGRALEIIKRNTSQ